MYATSRAASRVAGKRAKSLLPVLLTLGAILMTGCSSDPNAQKLKYLSSGDKLYKAGKYQEAVIQFRNAVQLDPKSGEARYQLGLTYLGLNNPEAAFKELTEAVALQPSNLDAHLKLASLHIVRREFDKATALAAKVIKADPKNGMAHAVLGQKHAAKGELADAVAELEKAIELAPKVETSPGVAITMRIIH